MLGLTSNDISRLWERRIDILEIRTPKWILQSVFAPLVLLFVFSLTSGFSTSALHQAAIAYVPFFLFSIGLYIWIRRLNIDRNSNQFAQRKAASIYGSFDASALVLISATALSSGLSVITLAKLSQGFTTWVMTFVIVVYLGGVLVVFAFSPKLLRRRAQSEKPDWSPVPRWANATISSLIGLAMVAGFLLARITDSGIDLAAGSVLLFAAAFAILPIYLRGLLEVIVPLLSGFDFGAATDPQ